MSLVLVGGSVRSGKSAFALSLARGLGARRAYLATAEGLDAEMQDRITRHRTERGAEFQTVEEPAAVPEAVGRLRDCDVVVVDCLTLWLSNLLLRNEPEGRILARVEELLTAIQANRSHAVIVTNEVGMGIVPESTLGRAFRDLAGRAHQRLAGSADRIYLAALGTMLRLKPGPVVCITKRKEIWNELP